jgi:hypothetical protein
LAGTDLIVLAAAEMLRMLGNRNFPAAFCSAAGARLWAMMYDPEM